MWTSSLSWRIEESGDPSELASEHLLPVQLTELLQRPSGRTPELRLMAAVLEDAIRLPVADGARVHSRAKVGAP